MASNKVIPKYTQVLPIQYANGDVLKAYLDEKFASKPYTMSASHPLLPLPSKILTLSKLRNNNWNITVPFRLSQVGERPSLGLSAA